MVFLLDFNTSHTSLNIPTTLMEQVALLKRYYLLMRSDSTSVLLSSLIITEATSLISMHTLVNTSDCF